MEEIIFKYFENLNIKQKEQIKMLYPLYKEWNDKINVISRKDIDQLYLHHVLHSLAIAKYKTFEDGSTILDVGTGGGFPSIPLAILFPDCNFILCDSVGKKIMVANEVAKEIGLTNIESHHSRVENLPGNFDYIISRAVAELKDFLPWVKGRYNKSIIYLKGGDLNEEISEGLRISKIPPKKIYLENIHQWFTEDFFLEKKIIEIIK